MIVIVKIVNVYAYSIFPMKGSFSDHIARLLLKNFANAMGQYDCICPCDVVICTKFFSQRFKQGLKRFICRQIACHTRPGQNAMIGCSSLEIAVWKSIAHVIGKVELHVPAHCHRDRHPQRVNRCGCTIRHGWPGKEFLDCIGQLD